MLEVWKPVEGYNDWYEVSNLGRVRSIDRYVTYSDGQVRFYYGQYLKSSVQISGYCTVGLRIGHSTKTVSVHRLVRKLSYLILKTREKLITLTVIKQITVLTI